MLHGYDASSYACTSRLGLHLGAEDPILSQGIEHSCLCSCKASLTCLLHLLPCHCSILLIGSSCCSQGPSLCAILKLPLMYSNGLTKQITCKNQEHQKLDTEPEDRRLAAFGAARLSPMQLWSDLNGRGNKADIKWHESWSAHPSFLRQACKVSMQYDERGSVSS